LEIPGQSLKTSIFYSCRKQNPVTSIFSLHYLPVFWRTSGVILVAKNHENLKMVLGDDFPEVNLVEVVDKISLTTDQGIVSPT